MSTIMKISSRNLVSVRRRSLQRAKGDSRGRNGGDFFAADVDL